MTRLRFAPDDLGMRMVITNSSLAQWGGTEVTVRDLAVGFRNRGHEVSVFSPVHGAVSDEIRAKGIEVVQDVWNLATPPDVIWGHHYLETLMALLRFESVPGLFSCHGIAPWEETAPRHPRIMLYLAIGDRTAARVRERIGVDGPEVRILFNGVDVQRFGRRASPGSRRLQKAVIYDRYVNPQQTAAILEACCAENIACTPFLDLSPPVLKPEEVLRSFDLVFAVGKSAIEALASGAAVVVCGVGGLGSLVSGEDVRVWQRRNSSAVSDGVAVTVEGVRAQLQRYRPEARSAATDFIRQNASLENYLDQAESAVVRVVELYRGGAVYEERHAFVACFLDIKEMLIQMGDDLATERAKVTQLEQALSAARDRLQKGMEEKTRWQKNPLLRLLCGGKSGRFSKGERP